MDRLSDPSCVTPQEAAPKPEWPARPQPGARAFDAQSSYKADYQAWEVERPGPAEKAEYKKLPDDNDWSTEARAAYQGRAPVPVNRERGRFMTSFDPSIHPSVYPPVCAPIWR